jgi:genome maintenance exonuclease 1
LFEWRKRVGEAEAQKISTRAANRGTLLHSMCEKYMLNDESFAQKQMPLTVELFKSIQKYIDAVEVVYGNEIPLYSHDLKTAGRSDVFCRIGGKNAILDFKTSSRLKTEEDIESYFL